jgi:hypothetical protein
LQNASDDLKSDIGGELMAELCHTPEAKHELELYKTVPSRENIEKAKRKVERILVQHKSRSGVERISLLMRNGVRRQSSKLYYAELTDNSKRHPVGISMTSLAEKMTEELIHPDALPAALADRRLQWSGRIERAKHFFFITLPQQLFAAFVFIAIVSLIGLILTIIDESPTAHKIGRLIGYIFDFLGAGLIAFGVTLAPTSLVLYVIVNVFKVDKINSRFLFWAIVYFLGLVFAVAWATIAYYTFSR